MHNILNATRECLTEHITIFISSATTNLLKTTQYSSSATTNLLNAIQYLPNATTYLLNAIQYLPNATTYLLQVILAKDHTITITLNKTRDCSFNFFLHFRF